MKSPYLVLTVSKNAVDRYPCFLLVIPVCEDGVQGQFSAASLKTAQLGLGSQIFSPPPFIPCQEKILRHYQKKLPSFFPATQWHFNCRKEIPKQSHLPQSRLTLAIPPLHRRQVWVERLARSQSNSLIEPIKGVNRPTEVPSSLIYWLSLSVFARMKKSCCML